MLIKSKQQNVDLWEAWIDTQTPTNGAATLFLIGDIFSNDRLAKPFFKKRMHSTPGILSLEIFPGITSEDGYITEIMYSEELHHLDQYTSIFIYAENELVFKIHEIEKIF